ncbi:hypothetical protein HAX54_006685, partial [Datura stramonium]|nr:hypothetical protein [Datura stramonium]
MVLLGGFVRQLWQRRRRSREASGGGWSFRRGYGVLRQLENEGRDERKEVNGAGK